MKAHSTMRKLLLSLILCLLCMGFVSAQENQTPYEIALQRIEEAEESGATELDLSVLGLTTLPPEIGNLSSLRTLSINSNQLTDLPPEIGRLNRLEQLYLFNNHLISLPPEIGSLSHLEMLYLSRNQLNSLPAEIGNLGKMQILSLTENQLSNLPPEIGKLDNLTTLYLNGNQLDSLPHEFAQLTSLCFLDLRHNQFQSLPIELGQLMRLADHYCSYQEAGLYLDYNPLISPPEEVLAEGTSTILAYLRNEAWWHLQSLIVGGAGAVGLVAAIVLGWRWKNRRGYEKKKKYK
jgi:hypothetical protein